MKSSAKEPVTNEEEGGSLFECSAQATQISLENGMAKWIVRLESPGIGDEDENMGHTECQQSVDLVKYGSKKVSTKIGRYLEEFDMMIKTQEEEIHRIAKDRVIKLSSHEKEFRRNFQTVHSSLIAAKISDHGIDQSSREYHESSLQLQHECTAVITNATNLIEVFQRSKCNLEPPLLPCSIATTWEEDITYLKRVLEAGRVVGASKVNSVVKNGSGTMSDDRTAGICEKGEGIAQHICWTMALNK